MATPSNACKEAAENGVSCIFPPKGTVISKMSREIVCTPSTQKDEFIIRLCEVAPKPQRECRLLPGASGAIKLHPIIFEPFRITSCVENCSSRD
jgi:hypothetical protein